MVEFVDGSVIAQISPPDMRLPIQYALTYPDRIPGAVERLDLGQSFSLHFEPPDRETFPSLDLGYRGDEARRDGGCGAQCRQRGRGRAVPERGNRLSRHFPGLSRRTRSSYV